MPPQRILKMKKQSKFAFNEFPEQYSGFTIIILAVVSAILATYHWCTAVGYMTTAIVKPVTFAADDS